MERREVIASTLAAIAHVGIGMAFAQIAPTPLWMIARVAKGQEIDLEREVVGEDAHAQAQGNAHAQAQAQGNAHAHAHANAQGNAHAHAHGDAQANAGERARGEEGWTFDPIRPGARDLSIDKGWAYTSPLLAPPKEDDTGAHEMIIGGMDARDRELGLSPDGPLVAATQNVARASRIPENSSGKVVVTFDQDGLVTGMQIDGSGDSDAWRDLKRDLLASMKEKKLRVPKGAKGMRITLRIVARLRTGAAHDKYQHVEREGIGVTVPWELTDALIDKTTVPVRVIDVITNGIERL